jgi:aminobenzoyl-glutamate utilization protein B
MSRAKVRMIRKAVGRDARAAAKVAGRIWEFAELGFREKKSSAALAEFLAERGFEVDFCIRSVPTAFRAVKGKGKPAIGMLGEYDALPECGEKPGANGHACGHNLLGTGGALGAVSAARLLEEKKKPGRIVFWGCPAEELLAGKVYMARDGAFRGLDACLAWHPSQTTGTNNAGGSSLDSLVFEFFGRTAHGAYPESGRSALDAALLMDVAVNYLREHTPDNIRIHSVIREGGSAPNVVPEYAKIWYYVRGRDRAQVDDVTKRLTLCAKGAATATETRMKRARIAALYSRLPNDALAEVVRDNVVAVGAPRPTAADLKTARKLGKKQGFQTKASDKIGTKQGMGSSDDDNVSRLAPFASFGMTCVPKGVIGHNRDYTRHTNLPYAYRGMTRAAEVLAGVAWDLLTKPKLLAKTKKEYRNRTKGFRYDPLVPKRQRYPLEGV